jgi:UDP-N-acetylglucosamine 1-carboxyvinyltransferase
VHGGNVKVFAPELHGTTISLKGKSGTTVLGTDNVMMAAVLAEGTTIIEDAAREPEVVDLALFLQKMGAKIDGAGSSRIVIEGVEELHGAEHEVIPDRIEAGTFLIAGAIAGKEVTVNRVRADHLTAVTDTLRDCGFILHEKNGSVSIRANGVSKPLNLETQPFPAFPTDMQAQMCALLSTVAGESSVTENVFPRRFMHVSEP